MTVPGIGPIISSAMVAAIGNSVVFSKGCDFGAWLGLVPKQFSTGDRTRHGLETPAPEAGQARRPALTAPVRGAPRQAQAGTKERPHGTNKGTAQTRNPQ